MVVAIVGLVLVGVGFLAVTIGGVIVAGGGVDLLPSSWTPWEVAFVSGWSAIIAYAVLIVIGKRLLNIAAGPEDD